MQESIKAYYYIINKYCNDCKKIFIKSIKNQYRINFIRQSFLENRNVVYENIIYYVISSTTLQTFIKCSKLIKNGKALTFSIKTTSINAFSTSLRDLIRLSKLQAPSSATTSEYL